MRRLVRSGTLWVMNSFAHPSLAAPVHAAPPVPSALAAHGGDTQVGMTPLEVLRVPAEEVLVWRTEREQEVDRQGQPRSVRKRTTLMRGVAPTPAMSTMLSASVPVKVKTPWGAETWSSAPSLTSVAEGTGDDPWSSRLTVIST